MLSSGYHLAMNRLTWILAALLATLLSPPPADAVEANLDTRESAKLSVTSAEVAGLRPQQIEPFFKDYKACFLLCDGTTGDCVILNPTECEQRKVPCSTFKIPNSIIGLDTGVLVDENHLFKWDGTKQFISDWERDHTLQSAVRHSVVWYYKRVAAGVGPDRMTDYLKTFDYGNQDISAGITQFWLGSPADGGSLKISANEQVTFLKRLYYGKLPVKQRSMDIAKRIIVLKQTPKAVLSGKTGSFFKDGKWILGWFVGYVVHDKKPYFFAANIEAGDNASGAKAREIVEKILESSGLL